MTNINIEVPDEDYKKFKMLCVTGDKTVKARINELILKEIGGKTNGKNRG